MNFYKHWLGDYQRDTADLSLMEHGAYRLLLDAYYATEEPFPADLGRLYRTARAVTPEEQEAVRTVVQRFFPIAEDGRRRNARADREIEETRSYTDKQRKAAERRWSGKNASADATAMPVDMPPHMPAAMPDECVGYASHSHSHSQTINNDDDNRASVLNFGHPDQQQVYEQYRRAHHNPTAFDATLRGLTQAMGGPAYPLEKVGEALLELSANNEGFNLSRLRGYLRGLSRNRAPIGQSEEERQARMLAIMEETLAARGIA